jgi:hypothetical protein
MFLRPLESPFRAVSYSVLPTGTLHPIVSCHVFFHGAQASSMTGVVAPNRPQGIWRRLRTGIERLGPYQSLALLAVPVCIVEPLKLAAVALAGEGRWFTGVAVIIAAYAASLVLVERLFRIVKPKLLKLHWFAKLWSGLIVIRYRLSRPLRRAS